MLHATIHQQVVDALNAATHENGYPHDFSRSPQEIVNEIHDWSGIERFNPQNATHTAIAALAVIKWREAQ